MSRLELTSTYFHSLCSAFCNENIPRPQTHSILYSLSPSRSHLHSCSPRHRMSSSTYVILWWHYVRTVLWRAGHHQLLSPTSSSAPSETYTRFLLLFFLPWSLSGHFVFLTRPSSSPLSSLFHILLTFSPSHFLSLTLPLTLSRSLPLSALPSLPLSQWLSLSLFSFFYQSGRSFCGWTLCDTFTRPLSCWYCIILGLTMCIMLSCMSGGQTSSQ